MSTMTGYGGAIGSVFGSITSAMAIKEQNNALEAEAQYNIDIYKAQLELSKFAQDNNNNMAIQIEQQIANEEYYKKQDVKQQETKAISKEVVRRSSGITAGASVQRSVDDVIKQGAKAKSDIETSGNKETSQLFKQVSTANNQEQLKVSAAYTNMTQKNQEISNNVITGINASMQVAESGINGYIQGTQLADSFERIGNNTPNKPSMFDYEVSMKTEDNFTTDVFGNKMTTTEKTIDLEPFGNTSSNKSSIFKI